LKISDSSSPDATSPSAKPRRVVALTGPSRPIDHSRHVARRDLAELGLAGTVFAQHYAEPLAFIVGRDVVIVGEPRVNGTFVVVLAAGATFHVLDIGKDWAWGRGDAPGTVGYVPADALTLP
jgi:hypothetical protein